MGKFDEKHNCFNIVLNFSEENTLRKEPLTICLKGKRKANDWMRTINEFKECQIDITKGKKDDKVLVDFRKINKIKNPNGTNFIENNFSENPSDKDFKNFKKSKE